MSTVLLIGHGLIGSKIREGLEKEGFTVVVGDIVNTADLKNFLELDINCEKSLDKAIDTLEKDQRKLVAVLNTSYPRTPTYGRKLPEVTLQSFNENVSVHLGGYFNVMKKFGFYFEKRGGGAVISFSSIYGVVAPRFEIYENMPFSMPVEYAAVKAALLHLNSYFAKFFKGKNVRFNSISPGGVYDKHDTNFVENYGKYSLGSSKGMISPEDLIASALFLCSEGARCVNGQNIIVDEGWSL